MGVPASSEAAAYLVPPASRAACRTAPKVSAESLPPDPPPMNASWADWAACRPQLPQEAGAARAASGTLFWVLPVLGAYWSSLLSSLGTSGVGGTEGAWPGSGLSVYWLAAASCRSDVSRQASSSSQVGTSSCARAGADAPTTNTSTAASTASLFDTYFPPPRISISHNKSNRMGGERAILREGESDDR